MSNTGTRGVFSAIKATIPSQSSSSHSMPAMTRLARARLPSQRAIPISTLPVTQTPVETKRSAPPQPTAMQRIASARLGTVSFPQPATPQDSSDAEKSNLNALEAAANARPAFRMGCKPIRDTEVDSLRHKVRGELRHIKHDLGRGNSEHDLPDSISIPAQELAQEVDAVEQELAHMRP